MKADEGWTEPVKREKTADTATIPPPQLGATLMMAAPSRDWNVFQQIFADHWERVSTRPSALPDVLL